MIPFVERTSRPFRYTGISTRPEKKKHQKDTVRVYFFRFKSVHEHQQFHPALNGSQFVDYHGNRCFIRSYRNVVVMQQPLS